MVFNWRRRSRKVRSVPWPVIALWEMLYCGKILYVDDLNTDEQYRSKGFGKILLDWLKAEARTQGCGHLHLDSGVQREQAHRFYFREGLTINCHHFHMTL
jgi:GNAT superfamily N-acetyltransferase